MSCQFISPFSDITKWGEEDTNGVVKFRDKVWRYYNSNVQEISTDIPQWLLKEVNITIKEVEENIEQMKYNVALSKMMVLLSHLEKYEGEISYEIWSKFVQILAPFAPFITEEMWNRMGYTTSVHLSEWPVYKESAANNDKVKVAVQVNGKLRGVIEIEESLLQEDVVRLALDSEKISRFITGEYKVKYVPGRVINFIVE